MEEIIGQAKWTTTNHTKGWSSPKKVMYGGIGKESSIMSSFWKTRQFQQVLFPFRPTESNHSKCPELLKRTPIIFDQENVRLHVSLMTRQKLLTAWLESSDWFTLFTRHHDFQYPVYFCLYKILLMEKMKKFLGRL